MAERKIFPERWIVYRITNIVNWKSYIGVTSYVLKYRWQKHVAASVQGLKKGKHDNVLSKAIRKYGEKSFDLSELYITDDRFEVMLAEPIFIVAFNSRTPNGYNMTIGGEGTFPRPPVSEETRAKMRAAHLGLPWSAKRRAIGNHHNRGRICSPETKLKMSIAQAGHHVSLKARLNYSSSKGNPFPGASWSNRRQKWTSEITISRRKIWLGCFDTAEQASATYLAALEFHFQPAAPC